MGYIMIAPDAICGLCRHAHEEHAPLFSDVMRGPIAEPYEYARPCGMCVCPNFVEVEQ